MPDQRQIREAEQKVADAERRIAEKDAKVREEEAALRELDADAKESERIRAQNQHAAARTDAEQARREKTDAEADLAEVRRGKFKKGKGTGGGSGEGDDDLSTIGGIFGSFMKETFGLDGSIFPDIGDLMPVKMLGTLLGAFKGPIEDAMSGQLGTPQQHGSFQPGAPVQSASGSGLPFGMIPSPFDYAGTAQPGMTPPGSPASGVGAGPAPGPVDQSRHNTVNVTASPGMEAIGTEVRRQMSNVDRLHTYVPKGF